MEILTRAKLHDSIFLGNKNLKDTLDCKEHRGLQLINDQEAQMLYARYNGECKAIPHTEVIDMTPADQSQLNTLFEMTFTKPPEQSVRVETATAVIRRGRTTAQASTPMGHVFAGPGAGKTNDR